MALIRDALTIVDSAAGKLFAQECQIDYPVEFYPSQWEIKTIGNWLDLHGFRMRSLSHLLFR